jgi:iron-sulfur cluster repair protein YtfE (RIC family)
VSNPVEAFGHTHEHLNDLVLEVGRLIRSTEGGDRRDRLGAALERLRDELLEHFAREEEGLFPYIRAHLPSKAEAVDRLERAHDSVCGAIVRLAHLSGAEHAGVEGCPSDALAGLHERFERGYAQHARDEAALLDELEVLLDERHRTELADRLRGL